MLRSFRNLPPSDPAWAVYSMTIYDSMVCFRVDRNRCFAATGATNDGIATEAENLWQQGTGIQPLIQTRVRLRTRFAYLERLWPMRTAQRLVFDSVERLWWRFRSVNLKKYFS